VYNFSRSPTSRYGGFPDICLMLDDVRYRRSRPSWIRSLARWRPSPAAAGLALVALVALGALGVWASAERSLERGVRHLEAGRVNDAIDSLTRALRRNPDLVPALDALGRAYLAKSWPEDALRELRRAAALAPNSATVTVNLGRVWLETGNAPAALAEANRVLAREPGHLGALALRGEALLAEYQTEEARAVFSSIAEVHPAAPDGHRGLGGVYRARGHVEAAVESYRTALARDGRDVTSLLSLARLLSEAAERPREALPLAAKAVELTPESAVALDTLGWIIYQLGEYSDALEVLSRALDQAPRAGTIHYHLGMAHYRLGAWTQAASALRRATDLDPELAQREGLQTLLRNLGG
jgi:tetratricopeptide (TPR) repeat protein